MQIFLKNNKQFTVLLILTFILIVSINCEKSNTKAAQPKVCSKIVGLLIVYTGTVVKVPQLLKIFKAKSVAGLAFISLFSENIGYAFTTAYNLHYGYPFSTYGENIFLMIQDTIILLTFVFFDKSLSLTMFVLYMSFYSLVCGLLFSGQAPEILFQFSIFVNMAILIFSRVPQIAKIYNEKSTGQLSFITTFCFFAGTIARAVTIFIEVDDVLQKILITMAAVANTIIFCQMLYYWNNTSTTSSTNAGSKQSSAQQSPAQKAAKQKKE